MSTENSPGAGNPGASAEAAGSGFSTTHAKTISTFEHEARPLLEGQDAALDAVFAFVGGTVETPPTSSSDPDAEKLSDAVRNWGLSPETAEALGWQWCADSRDLPDLRARDRARPYAGVRVPRATVGGATGWAFVPVPPAEDRAVLTPPPHNVLAVLPDWERVTSQVPLHLADDPVSAARLWEQGRAVAWVRGPDGWRGPKRRLLPDLATLASSSPVVLHPSRRDLDDPKTFTRWRQLAEQLADCGSEVRVATTDGEVPASVAFAAARRPKVGPAPPDSAPSPPGQSAPRDRPFAGTLAEADKLYPRGQVSFMRRSGFAAEGCALAIKACLGRVAQGPGGPWAYDNGLWRPASGGPEGGIVGRLAARLLGDDYTPTREKTVLELLNRLPDLPLLHGHPQADRWDHVVNFANGLLHWRTGELRPHDPEVLSTWQLPVAYEPGAPYPTFRQFLTEVLPDDMLEKVDGVAAWQEDLGYLLLPGNPLHVAFLFRGDGRNGKGVLMDIMRALVGPDAVSSLSLEDMVSNRAHFRLAGLVGSALNLCGELDPKFLASTAAFKGLTGGDVVQLERKNRDPFDYRPWATPVFSANDDFASVDRSTAYFARWQVGSFPRVIPAERRDPKLAARIIESELPGIAAAAIDGLRSLMARGHFREVQSAAQQKRQFQRHSDHVSRFIEERVLVDPTRSTPRPALYEAYTAWCEDEGIHRSVPAATLLKGVRQHAQQAGVDVEEQKVHGGKYVVHGVGLPTAGAR